MLQIRDGAALQRHHEHIANPGSPLQLQPPFSPSPPPLTALHASVACAFVQMVVTFHGGMVAIGYEWGSLNHPKPNDGSPDDNANREIAAQLRAYAGARRSHHITTSPHHQITT